MARIVREDSTPRAVLNKAAWRAVTIAALVIALSLLATLVAQNGLFTGDPGLPEHPDALTTLALVLAILAFLIQIFVFIFQTQASAASERRSERLNARTFELLGKIEANSSATEKVLFANFQQLLDYLVGTGDGVQDSELVEEAHLDDGGEEGDDAPVTASDVLRMFNELNRTRERPRFEPQPVGGPSKEDERIIEFLRTWPDREPAEAVVAELAKLPPLALAALVRLGHRELTQRRQGQPVGMRKASKIVDPLIAAGWVKNDGGLISLTEGGRDVVRILPIGKPLKDARPDWYEEVLAPLMRSEA